MNHPTSIYFNGIRRGAHPPCVCHFSFLQAHPPLHRSQRDPPIWHSGPLIDLYQNPIKKHNEARREERGEIKIKYIISNFRFHKSRKKDLYLQFQCFEELMETQFTESHEKMKEVRLRPLLNQMIIAILWSSIILLILPIVLGIILTLWQYGFIPNTAGIGIAFGMSVIISVLCFLPCNTFILMALHWSRIVQYIIYSKILVIIESIIFLLFFCVFLKIPEKSNYNVVYPRSLMLTGLSIILLALIFRWIFRFRYVKFRNHYKSLYEQINPLKRYFGTKEVDVCLISALLLGAAISICFFFTF